MSKEFVDLQNREMDSLVDDYVKRRIADLEAKLAEKDRAIENWQTMYESVMQTCSNDADEIDRLNKLLAEKEKELESITESSRVIILSHIEFTENINKNKISFVVEQLELLKEKIANFDLPNNPKLYNNDMFCGGFDSHYIKTKEQIDNQIEQLKEKQNESKV